MNKGKEIRNYNENHLELKDGEMFLTNDTRDEYDCIGWKTKRMGQQAYIMQGEAIYKVSPVFIQKKEWEEGMKKYER